MFLLFFLLIVQTMGDANISSSVISIPQGNTPIVGLSLGVDMACLCNSSTVMQTSMFDIVNNASYAQLDIISDIIAVSSCYAFESNTLVVNDTSIINYFDNEIQNTLVMNGNINMDVGASDLKVGVCDTVSFKILEFNDTTHDIVTNYTENIICTDVAIGETDNGDTYYAIYDTVSGNITIYNEIMVKTTQLQTAIGSILATYNGKFVLKNNDEFKTIDMESGIIDTNSIFVPNTGRWTVGKNDGSLIVQSITTNNILHYEWGGSSWDENARYTIELSSIIDKIDAFNIGSYIYTIGWMWVYVDADTFTDRPTNNPTIPPTFAPSLSPTISPSNNPSNRPSNSPSNSPSTSPTNSPSGSPTTKTPTLATSAPTINIPSPTIMSISPTTVNNTTESDPMVVILVVVSSVIFLMIALYVNHIMKTNYDNDYWNHI